MKIKYSTKPIEKLKPGDWVEVIKPPEDFSHIRSCIGFRFKMSTDPDQYHNYVAARRRKYPGKSAMDSFFKGDMDVITWDDDNTHSVNYTYDCFRKLTPLEIKEHEDKISN